MKTTFEEAFKIVTQLSKEFEDNFNYYKSIQYQEAEVRKDFIDKMIYALGWDVDHKEQKNPYKQEVKIEKTQNQEGERGKKFADYAFYLEPDFKNAVFFIEAKRPSILLEDNPDCYLQTHKYGWNAQVPISILTDFEEFIIIDCRSKPDPQSISSTAIKIFHFKDYQDVDKFKEIYYLFSREAVADNSIKNFVDTQIPKQKGKERQGKLFSGAYKSVDDDFLEYIDSLRLDLARGFIELDETLNSEQLTEATQKTIDRLVFIRFLEDKQIEFVDYIYNIKKWKDFIKISKQLDTKYNGVVFKDCIIDRDNFKGIKDDVFMDICFDISSKESPYHFNAIPIHILGNIYERFLGKLVSVYNGKVDIILKPEVRKAGGVFYTPKYIVDSLVNKTVGEVIKGKEPKEIDELSFADISCGSGSFLIGVYEKLIDYHKEYYQNKLSDKTSIDGRSDDIGNVIFKDGAWILTLKRKQDILLNCIYGVDIDNQAVEVTQFSLFLKLLEDESLSSTSKQTTLLSRVLPDLTTNILCGNSLVGWDILSTNSFTHKEEKELNPFDFKTSFKKVFRNDGFNVIVGNPPYVKEPTDKEIFEKVKISYLKKYYQGKMDLWYFFVCNGLDLLKENGLLGYIAPNNWTTNAGASIMRNKIINDSQIIEIIDFGSYMVFADASIQTMNFILQKSQKSKSYSLKYGKLLNHNKTPETALDLLNNIESDNHIILNPKLKRTDFIDKYILFGEKSHEVILDKIQAKLNFELTKNEMTNGIHPHHGYLTKDMLPLLDNKYSVGTGVFALNDKEYNELILLDTEKELIKPFYSTTEKLKRYYIDNHSGEKIIYTDSSFKNIEKINAYPNIKVHLDKFTKIITSDNKPYGLHRARKQEFFTGEKIIVVRKCLTPTFIFDEKDNYFSAAFYIIKSSRIDLKYLIGILNSDLIKFWLKNRGKMQGNNYQLDKEPLLKIPICNTNNHDYKNQIIKLVDNIIEIKQLEINATTTTDIDFFKRKLIIIESNLNQLVYDIYDINKDEISVIEKNIN